MGIGRVTATSSEKISARQQDTQIGFADDVEFVSQVSAMPGSSCVPLKASLETDTILRLTRLGTEIQRTWHRLNALDHLLISRLESERDFIQVVLDERERSDHFRFKLMKRILGKKRGRIHKDHKYQWGTAFFT